MPIQYTGYGRDLDPCHILAEYPRPQLMRDNCCILNGYWDYAITDTPKRPERPDGKILVPFSPEAPLSGVSRTVRPGDYLHYRRSFPLKKPEGGRHILLHFGAVDQDCEVIVNDKLAGRHSGGYLPFSLDVTRQLMSGENELRLVVTDPTDSSFHSRGKQTLRPGGMWYTAQSGIWQTVWAEEVPEAYIRALRITADFDRGCVRLKVLGGGTGDKGLPVTVRVSLRGEMKAEAEITSGRTYTIPLPDFESWTPEQPVLYDLSLRLGEDEVQSYFAMRKVSVGWDSSGQPRFFLNNRPYFQSGLLDQGYYPGGLYTAPSDEALKEDIRLAKKLGFNMLRKHIKIEPDRWYYHCDREGMLVWQDMVSGGSRYRTWFVTLVPNLQKIFHFHVPDDLYGFLSRRNAEGRKEYFAELRQTIRALHNHPSIVTWVAFNEGWGQFDAVRATALIRRLDPNRLVDESSGWFDQGSGDMESIHHYYRPFRMRRAGSRPVALTECGGFSLKIPGHSKVRGLYGYRTFHSREALTKGIVRMWVRELIPALKKGLSAVVYTQLSDVEGEVNGLVTYDRKVLKIRGGRLLAANRKLLRAFDDLTACDGRAASEPHSACDGRAASEPHSACDDHAACDAHSAFDDLTAEGRGKS